MVGNVDPQIDKELQTRPLSLPSPTVYPTADDDQRGLWGGSSYEYLRKRRCLLCCCGCCGAAVVLLGVVILILAFTVFKVKDPSLTMNSLSLDRLFVPGIGSPSNPVSVNATLTADISIKNPNVASFRFRNSTTEFFYGGVTVGVAYAPGGYVKARRTARMNVTVDVMADRVLFGTNAFGAAVLGGGANLSSYTDVPGRVELLGVYKRDLDILLNCSFTLDVLERTLTNRMCWATVM